VARFPNFNSPKPELLLGILNFFNTILYGNKFLILRVYASVTKPEFLKPILLSQGITSFYKISNDKAIGENLK
jgi:hypothetical protein